MNHSKTYWLSKKLDVLHCVSGNHDAQQHICSSCSRALMKFSVLLLPCSTSPCDWEWPGAPFMKLTFQGQRITRAATMSLTNSDPLSLRMILGNLKYENTCILIPFATTRASLDTNGNITWNLENDRQRDIYSDTDHQAYSAYQSNRSKISTIDNIFIEIFAAINHWIPSFFSFFFNISLP